MRFPPGVLPRLRAQQIVEFGYGANLSHSPRVRIALPFMKRQGLVVRPMTPTLSAAMKVKKTNIVVAYDRHNEANKTDVDCGLQTQLQ